MKFFGLAFGLFLAVGVYSSCGYTPVDPPRCDTCTVPCDTCAPCDTCVDTTRPPDLDSLSHAFTWTEYEIPTESSLNGVLVLDSTTVVVTGLKLYALQSDGFVRRDVKLQDGRSASFGSYRLFGFGPSDYWAAYGSIIKHVRGPLSAFEVRLVDSGVMSFPDDGLLQSCWGTSSSDMFFVGEKGTIVHFDGTNWTKFPKVTTKPLQKVWGTTHSDVWACGSDQTTGESVLLHYNGTVWSEEPLESLDIRPGKHSLITVWATDSGGIPIVYGAGGLFYKRLRGSMWQVDTLTNELGGGSYEPLYAIRGNSTTDVMVLGGSGYVTHWNGKTWKDYGLYKGGIGFDTWRLSFKGNTAAIVGYRNGSGYVAVGRRK